METQDKVLTVLVGFFGLVYSSVVGLLFTTDIGNWLSFLTSLLIVLGMLLVALMAIPMVPDLVPDDIVNLIFWLGIFLLLLWIFLGMLFAQFNIASPL